MKKYQRRQLWLVNFDPSFGHEYRKCRPALILQNNQYISSSTLLTVIPISSQIDKPAVLDILIKKDIENRLMKDSLLKVEQISSFDKRRFIKLIGVVNSEAMPMVENNVKLFQLW